VSRSLPTIGINLRAMAYRYQQSQSRCTTCRVVCV